MAYLSQRENGRRITTSKLEQTILTNRTMNILLEKRLNLIEVDRKRALAASARMQREVQADFRAMKDEKFDLMLKYKMKKAATSGPVSADLPPHPSSNDFANEIEGELFTNGLVNAPGVNPRMKRLENRRRILPDFSGDEETEEQNLVTDQNNEPDNVFVETEVNEFSRIRPITAPELNSRQNVVSTTEPANPSREANTTPAAAIMMTSGIVSFINKNARLKQVAKSEESDEEQVPVKTAPVPLTGFGFHSQMRNQQQSTPRSLPTISARDESHKRLDRKKSVQFSRHRKSIVIVPEIFGEEDTEEEAVLSSRMNGKGSHSRLSMVKSKIESNEKEFLLRLRIKNQKLENEDVAKRVWEFIGKRPVSVAMPKRLHPQNTSVESDVLSEAEEQTKMSKFRAAASKTSKNP